MIIRDAWENYKGHGELMIYDVNLLYQELLNPDLTEERRQEIFRMLVACGMNPNCKNASAASDKELLAGVEEFLKTSWRAFVEGREGREKTRTSPPWEDGFKKRISFAELLKKLQCEHRTKELREIGACKALHAAEKKAGK